MKGIKIKPIKYHFMLDTDRDKVPDFKDCRPFNPRLQHIKPNKLMRMDIVQLPIYVSDKPGHEYHVLSKRAKKYAPRARTEMLSAIKKRPSIVGDVKELGEIGLFPSEESIHQYREHKDALEKLKKMKYSPDLEGMEEQLGVPSIGEEEKLFRYVHKSWGSPQSIATNVRFKMGSEIKDIDSSELGRGERAKKLVEDESLSGMMSLEPFARRLEKKKLEMQEKHKTDFYSYSTVSPDSFDIFDKDEALLQLGMMGSSKKEVDNVSREYDEYLKDPHKYKGPYSGKKDRPYFTQMVKKGTKVFQILDDLNTSEMGRTWAELKSIQSDMDLGTLSNMQDTGIIVKQDYLYLITDLGRGVLQEVKSKGSWKYRDYVPKHSTKTTPIEEIHSGTVSHKILRLLAGMPIEDIAIPSDFVGSGCNYPRKTIPIRADKLRTLGEGNLGLRRLESAGLIFRPREGWYQITRKGWNALRMLDRGDVWRWQ